MASFQKQHDESFDVVEMMQKDFLESWHYEEKRSLGRGTFGEVIMAVSKNTEDYPIAVKKFAILKPGDSLLDIRDRRRRIEQMFWEEIEIMQRLQHPNLMPIIYSFQCPTYFGIIMPYSARGDLFGYLPQITMWEMQSFSKQLTEALIYMHDKCTYHSDIKPENVLLFGDNAVLSDFGFSGMVPARTSKVMIARGTNDFRAPETLLGKPVNPFKADIYSLGLTIWCIVTKGKDDSLENFRAELITFRNNTFMPPDYWYIIRRLTYLLPHRRPSLEKILPEM